MPEAGNALPRVLRLTLQARPRRDDDVPIGKKRADTWVVAAIAYTEDGRAYVNVCVSVCCVAHSATVIDEFRETLSDLFKEAHVEVLDPPDNEG